MSNTASLPPLKLSAPERGSFPMDLGNECGAFVKKYLDCVRRNKGDNPKCRQLSRDYLDCRMQKNLMDKDKMENLGFHAGDRGERTKDSKLNFDKDPPPIYQKR